MYSLPNYLAHAVSDGLTSRLCAILETVQLAQQHRRARSSIALSVAMPRNCFNFHHVICGLIWLAARSGCWEIQKRWLVPFLSAICGYYEGCLLGLQTMVVAAMIK